jgi:hypothetical protein
MRKNKLIEILNAIEGNPEIMLWNGYAGDYMDINKELVSGSLVKMTFDYYLQSCKMEHIRDNSEKDWNFEFSEEETERLRKYYKTFQWEENEFVSIEDIEKKRYTEKRIFYIETKPRNKTTWDRVGKTTY